MRKIWVILVILAFLGVSCKHHHHDHNENPSNPIALAKPYHAMELGSIPYHTIDLAVWGNAIFFAPYLNYSQAKIYILNNNHLYAETMNAGRVESIYRVWVAPDNQVYATTEQPPMLLKRENNKWKILTKYASKGWAVLGNVDSSKMVWSGWSYRNQSTHIFRNFTAFPSLGKRIVWWVESYNKTYFAGTSGTTTYKNYNDGVVYRWTGSNWAPVLSKVGGVIRLEVYKSKLFAGTVKPQTILEFDGKAWKTTKFSDSEEISAFWTDEKSRFFTASTEHSKIHVRQYYQNQWVEIWSIPAKSERWGVQGCVRGNAMIIAFWDRNRTRVWQIDYK